MQLQGGWCPRLTNKPAAYSCIALQQTCCSAASEFVDCELCNFTHRPAHMQTGRQERDTWGQGCFAIQLQQHGKLALYHSSHARCVAGGCTLVHTTPKRPQIAAAHSFTFTTQHTTTHNTSTRASHLGQRVRILPGKKSMQGCMHVAACSHHPHSLTRPAQLAVSKHSSHGAGLFPNTLAMTCSDLLSTSAGTVAISWSSFWTVSCSFSAAAA